MWIELKTPVEVCTPNGTQFVRRVWDNGDAATVRITFDDNYSVEGTAEHRLHLNGDWVMMRDIVAGMTDGTHTVTDTGQGSTVQTYDIEVDNEHCFFLENGVLSHNSTALLQGGCSEGINPDPAMVFTQLTAGGEVPRIVPELYKVMIERGVYNNKTVREIADAFGSVQGVEWLSDDEKDIFKTAFEIDQTAVVRMGAARQRFIDQSQSLNLFFNASDSEEYIASVHQEGINSDLVSLYYVATNTGINAERGACSACEG